MHDHQQHAGMSWRIKLGLLVFAAVAGFYLWIEHRTHLLGIAPFLIFLACPLMHLFMHGDHDNHGGNGEEQNPDKGGKS